MTEYKFDAEKYIDPSNKPPINKESRTELLSEIAGKVEDILEETGYTKDQLSDMALDMYKPGFLDAIHAIKVLDRINKEIE